MFLLKTSLLRLTKPPRDSREQEIVSAGSTFLDGPYMWLYRAHSSTIYVLLLWLCRGLDEIPLSLDNEIDAAVAEYKSQLQSKDYPFCPPSD